ncbi:uncharacterized protein LOC130405768 [Gadus chalcogrammus]|uniref:uncharacterized protein LOC130405768 n=1 Tax=Gadus chalcogrammus TaxID=1042646 RepID=UPI0024C4E00E|nr:uncharacterized protein LOC130405768 [Gadus chalcogrammus]
MAGLGKYLPSWLGSGSETPSTPQSRGTLEFAKHHSENVQTLFLKSEKSFDKDLTMSSSSAHSMQEEFMSPSLRLLSRHGELFPSLPLERPKSGSLLEQLSHHGELSPSLPLERPQSDGALGELQRIHSEFVKTVKISVIRGLLDDLLQQKVLSTEDKDSVIENQKSKREKARCLIDMATGNGERASQIMIDSMKKRDPDLCITLGLISSPAGVGLKEDKTVVKPRKEKRGNGGRKRRTSESEEEEINKKSCTVDGSGSNTETRSAGQALTEKELLMVAETLGQEWEQVAIHLGLGSNDLDTIKAEHTSVAMQKQKMLLLWQRRSGKATAQDLLRGLEDMKDLPLETRQLLTGMMKKSSE